MRKPILAALCLFLWASLAPGATILDPGMHCHRHGADELLCDSQALTESKRAPTWELYPLPAGDRADVARGWFISLYTSPGTDYRIIMRATRDGVHWIATCELSADQSECSATARRP
jgi:hypothetical protein